METIKYTHQYTDEFIMSKTPDFSLLTIKNLLKEKEKQLGESEWEIPKLEFQILLLKNILNHFDKELKQMEQLSGKLNDLNNKIHKS